MTAHAIFGSTFSTTIRCSATLENREGAQTYGNVDILGHTQDLCEKSQPAIPFFRVSIEGWDCFYQCNNDENVIKTDEGFFFGVPGCYPNYRRKDCKHGEDDDIDIYLRVIVLGLENSNLGRARDSCR